jgi:hypothetical protein
MTALDALRQAADALEIARKTGDEKKITEAKMEHAMAMRRYDNDMELMRIAPVVLRKLLNGTLDKEETPT